MTNATVPNTVPDGLAETLVSNASILQRPAVELLLAVPAQPLAQPEFRARYLAADDGYTVNWRKLIRALTADTLADEPDRAFNRSVWQQLALCASLAGYIVPLCLPHAVGQLDTAAREQLIEVLGGAPC